MIKLRIKRGAKAEVVMSQTLRDAISGKSFKRSPYSKNETLKRQYSLSVLYNFLKKKVETSPLHRRLLKVVNNPKLDADIADQLQSPTATNHSNTSTPMNKAVANSLRTLLSRRVSSRLGSSVSLIAALQTDSKIIKSKND